MWIEFVVVVSTFYPSSDDRSSTSEFGATPRVRRWERLPKDSCTDWAGVPMVAEFRHRKASPPWRSPTLTRIRCEGINSESPLPPHPAQLFSHRLSHSQYTLPRHISMPGLSLRNLNTTTGAGAGAIAQGAVPAPAPIQLAPPVPPPAPIPGQVLAPAFLQAPVQAQGANTAIANENDENIPPPIVFPPPPPITIRRLVILYTFDDYKVLSKVDAAAGPVYPFGPWQPPVMERPRIVGYDELVFR